MALLSTLLSHIRLFYPFEKFKRPNSGGDLSLKLPFRVYFKLVRNSKKYLKQKLRNNLKLFSLPILLLVFSACEYGVGKNPAPLETDSSSVQANQANTNKVTDSPKPPFPEIKETPETTNSPIGKVDFANWNYPLPRGWQDISGEEAILENGKREMSKEQIGLKLEKVKYFEVTGDNSDEAIVILSIETGGSATPKVVYIFTVKEEIPELIWYFRTGDRADGGLRNIYGETGELVVELFGQDRYIFGAVETMKITGDEEDLCCPTHFTRTRYAHKGGKTFIMQGKRETFTLADKDAPPIENMGDVRNEEQKKSK